VSSVVLQRQDGNFCEIVLWHFHYSIKESQQMLALKFGWVGVRPVAFQAQGIRVGSAKKVRVVPAVRCVTRGASLFEGRLMKMLLATKLCLLGVATQADVDRVRLGQSRRLAGVRVVTVCAFSQGSRMLDLSFLDLFRFIGVAGDAQLFRAGLGQHDLAVFGRLMTAAARAVAALKRDVHKSLHQFGAARLVWIMALQTIRRRKGLVIVCFAQAVIFRIMTVQAELRRRFRQVVGELGLGGIAGFMHGVASVATHIERSVAAAFVGNSHPGRMAAQAEVRFLTAGNRLQ